LCHKPGRTGLRSDVCDEVPTLSDRRAWRAALQGLAESRLHSSIVKVPGREKPSGCSRRARRASSRRPAGNSRIVQIHGVAVKRAGIGLPGCHAVWDRGSVQRGRSIAETRGNRGFQAHTPSLLPRDGWR
jgi:hypothetical protein